MFREMLAFAVSLSFASLAQSPKAVAVPDDPLELVTGDAQLVETAEGRETAFALMTRARSHYAPRNAGAPFSLKVHFTVDSEGQTQHDGEWEMEEIFAPGLGRRWTAKAAAGYHLTQIGVDGMEYGEEAVRNIPLRLQEARAALFDPIGTNPNALRTASATYRGVPVTCFLTGAAETIPTVTGRRWDEAESCIDPETGLLQTHSANPGRYAAYDYTNAPAVGKLTLPRSVTLTEAGKVITRIQVDSLTEASDLDPKQFAATKEMKWGVTMVGLQKIFVNPQKDLIAADATLRPVCIFGLLTPSGDLVEAHSLQPSDPNSRAALEYVKTMKYFGPSTGGGQPSQHFVFIIEKFIEAH